MLDPGTQWAYGIGTDWVGLLVEAASGQTLGEYFAEHVTGPLGMTSTVFEATPDIESRLAAMHLRLDDGTSTRSTVLAHRTRSSKVAVVGCVRRWRTTGGSSACSSTTANSTGPGSSPDTVALMVTNNIGDLRVSKLETVMPSLSNDAELFPGDEKTWASPSRSTRWLASRAGRRAPSCGPASATATSGSIAKTGSAAPTCRRSFLR
ncbi:MAG: serine hydrolase domain-containing protein [Acidimicrobiales bacterium]